MTLSHCLLKRQNAIVELVDEITEKKKKQNDTTKLENQIDKLVYKLYGLTKEEMKIIDEYKD